MLQIENRLDHTHKVLRRFSTGECCEILVQTTCDFVARRTRLAFLDVEAARTAVPEVNKLLAKELGWGSWRAARELKDANALLDTFTC